MTAPLRRLQVPETLLRQAGEVWFEHSDESLFIIAVEPDRFVFELLNPAHERRTGLRNSDVSGRTPHECLPAAVADAVTDHYRACVEAGEAIRYEETLDLPSGVRHWHTVLTPVRDDSGRIYRLLGSCRDVTVEHEALRREEETRRLTQKMIEASPDILYVYDLVEHRNVFISGQAREILGWSRDEIAGMHEQVLNTLTHPEDLPAVRDHLSQLRSLSNEAIAEVEYRMRRPDGRYVWLHSREKVFQRGTDGLVSRIFGSAICIQLYKDSQAELSSAKGLLHATLDSLTAQIAILDASGRIIAVNQAWREFAEHNVLTWPTDPIGADYVRVFRACAGCEPHAAAVAEGVTALLAGTRSDFQILYLCGSRRFLLRANRFEHEGAVHAVLAHEDVTELASVRRELDATAERLLGLQEEERRRIGAELHDSTTQHLAAAGLGLAQIQQLVPDDPDLAAVLERATASLAEAQREIRAFSYLLFPPSLDRDGLASTLRHFIQGFARRTSLKLTCRIDDAADGIAPPVQRTVLRVVQEALTNVHRHAQATRVSVRIQVDGPSLTLRITDNGVGLAGANDDPVPELGVGIPGMRSRVRQFGGDLTLTSGRRGTRVQASIPLHPTADGGSSDPPS
ncbi:PAS domain S-box protein [Microvirga sp. BT688]|uniref:PAS domain-containing sensor histidine kinase n=1 Tax=Microvirga sp. TaxID=1873136 RepID=UPI00168542D7|nr:PAS domain-containing protein [Microvirga sp.]MBD2750579.1 PAS domain S-box protein [Microvirga sp.]